MLYLAAVLIVASVALFVAAPLGGGLLTSRRIREAAEAERLEHERALAMQGLRELDFDREMGKLAAADYAALREGFRRAPRSSACGRRSPRGRGWCGRSSAAPGRKRAPARRRLPPRRRKALRARRRASASVRNAARGSRRPTFAPNAARRSGSRPAPRRGPSDERRTDRGAGARQELRRLAGPARRDVQRRSRAGRGNRRRQRRRQIDAYPPARRAGRAELRRGAASGRAGADTGTRAAPPCRLGEPSEHALSQFDRAREPRIFCRAPWGR